MKLALFLLTTLSYLIAFVIIFSIGRTYYMKPSSTLFEVGFLYLVPFINGVYLMHDEIRGWDSFRSFRTIFRTLAWLIAFLALACAPLMIFCGNYEAAREGEILWRLSWGLWVFSFLFFWWIGPILCIFGRAQTWIQKFTPGVICLVASIFNVLEFSIN